MLRCSINCSGAFDEMILSEPAVEVETWCGKSKAVYCGGNCLDLEKTAEMPMTEKKYCIAYNVEDIYAMNRQIS